MDVKQVGSLEFVYRDQLIVSHMITIGIEICTEGWLWHNRTYYVPYNNWYLFKGFTKHCC